MKLEINVKYNIGDKIYYLNTNYKPQLGKITAIYLYKDKIKYEVNERYIFTDNNLFSSEKECARNDIKFAYNVFDTIYYCLNKVLYSAFIVAKSVNDRHLTYTVENSNGDRHTVFENHLYSTLEEALKHF